MWSAATASTTASQRQAIIYATVGAATGAAWYSSRVLLEEAGGDDEATNHTNVSNPIEINLMDKIANKVYLNPARAAARNQRRLVASSSSFQANSSSSVALDPESSQRRPLGVPSRLRILAIDLPEVRTQAFSRGTCRVAFDRIFPNGVAPPTYVLDNSNDSMEDNDVGSRSKHPKKDNSTKETANISPRKNKSIQMVEQKAFVQSMLRCFHDDNNHTSTAKVGVEVLEASFEDLNPRNLRKTRQVGGYHYDPGKYASDTHHQMSDRSSTEKNDGDNQNESNNITISNRDEVDHIPQDDESDAPWNQYAWMEELKMRVSECDWWRCLILDCLPPDLFHMHFCTDPYHTLPSNRFTGLSHLAIPWSLPPGGIDMSRGIFTNKQCHPKELPGKCYYRHSYSQTQRAWKVVPNVLYFGLAAATITTGRPTNLMP